MQKKSKDLNLVVQRIREYVRIHGRLDVRYNIRTSPGKKEEEIIDNIQGVIRQVIDQEKNARQSLLSKHRERLEDRIWRSYGTLVNAHIISSKETVELLSMLRLGLDLGIVKGLQRSLINELFILTQPAHLQKIEKKKLSPQERDVQRAELIRQKIKRD